jgi:hypothetical protein
MRVRKLSRAADDGYSSSLVPGLRATADAESLAEELGFAVGRLTELSSEPRGLFAEAALAADRDEGVWLAAQVVLLGPLDEADDPFAAVQAVAVPWAGGEIPSLDGFPLGSRSPFASPEAATKGFVSLRAWASRLGGPAAALSGDIAWTPERRFERIFERLGTVAGLGRARYDLLNVAGKLALAEVEAPSLLAGQNDDATNAAKRVFGIGDPILLNRRASELMEEAEIPMGALDLALVNLDRPAGRPRLLVGASADVTDADAWARAASALRVG